MKNGIFEAARHLRNHDLAMSLRMLGAAYGLGYTRIRQMRGLPGFPMIAGKVIPSDFDRWRRVQAGLHSPHLEDPPRSAVDKARGLTLKNDSRVSWRQIASNLRAATESLESPGGNGSSDS